MVYGERIRKHMGLSCDKDRRRWRESERDQQNVLLALVCRERVGRVAQCPRSHVPGAGRAVLRLCSGRPRVGQAALLPVVEQSRPVRKKTRVSWSFGPASFHIGLSPLCFSAAKHVHSSQKVGSLINDFLCLDDKCLSSLEDKSVFWRVNAFWVLYNRTSFQSVS